jgi:hypothetical protein
VGGLFSLLPQPAGMCRQSLPVTLPMRSAPQLRRDSGFGFALGCLYRGETMRVLAAILTLLVSSAAAAQECKTCSMADACTKAYFKATSEAQSATKQAIRDWKQNLDRKASAELSSRGALALQDAMETQVRSELERLKECLAKIR